MLTIIVLQYEENYMTRQEITQINDELIKTIKDEVNALRKENSDLQENIRLKFEEQKDLNVQVAQNIQTIEKSQDLMTINIKDLDKDFKGNYIILVLLYKFYQTIFYRRK